MCNIITLTTDFGLKDYYCGAVKGRLLWALKSVDVVDITHQIAPFGIKEGAYVLKRAYTHFPKKTIHIIGVDTQEKRSIVALYDGHYFVGADNGLLSMVFGEQKPEIVVEIVGNKPSSFPTLDVFCPAAEHLAKGYKIRDLGAVITEMNIKKELSPTMYESPLSIKGHIVHIDRYGNAVTNINKEKMSRMFGDSSFEISVGGYDFYEVFINFADVIRRQKDAGERLAVYNSDNNLIIAVYRSNPEGEGSAFSLLGMNLGMNITITAR